MTLSQCYLSNLPRKFVRTTAGFVPAQDSYYLPRAAVASSTPFKSHSSATSGHGDEWNDWYKQGLGEPKDDRLDVAGQGFLRLLRLLLSILVLDSVLQIAKLHHT
jgi:hypothetical protein